MEVKRRRQTTIRDGRRWRRRAGWMTLPDARVPGRLRWLRFEDPRSVPSHPPRAARRATSTASIPNARGFPRRRTARSTSTDASRYSIRSGTATRRSSAPSCATATDASSAPTRRATFICSPCGNGPTDGRVRNGRRPRQLPARCRRLRRRRTRAEHARRHHGRDPAPGVRRRVKASWIAPMGGVTGRARSRYRRAPAAPDRPADAVRRRRHRTPSDLASRAAEAVGALRRSTAAQPPGPQPGRSNSALIPHGAA